MSSVRVSALAAPANAVLVALAAAALAAPATAGAAPHLQSARFKATLSGAESVAWSMNTTNACGGETGSGSQHVRLHQKGRLTLIFSRQLGGTRLLFVKVGGTRSNIVPIAGTMSRYGVLNFAPNGKCPTGRPEGPAVTPPQPDCGEKSFTGTIEVNWSPADSYPGTPGEPTPLLPQLWVEEPYSTTTFAVCPFMGPLLIFRLAHAGLSEKRIFGPQPKMKLISNAEKVAQYPETSQGVRSETSVGWTLQLTRLGTGGGH